MHITKEGTKSNSNGLVIGIGGERMIQSISAGTGPAAAILIGGLLLMSGNSLGGPLILGGFLLSFIWASRFM